MTKAQLFKLRDRRPVISQVEVRQTSRLITLHQRQFNCEVTKRSYCHHSTAREKPLLGCPAREGQEELKRMVP